MLSSLFLALTLAFTSVVAVPTTNATIGTCGTTVSAAAAAKAEEHFMAHRVAFSGDEARAPANIPIIWHVVAQDQTFNGGNAPDAQIASQLNIMNQRYAQYGISFRTIEVRRYINPNWHNNAFPNTAAQTQMKNALHVGTAGLMNVYIVKLGFGQQLGGYSSFPFEYPSAPTQDGIVVSFVTLPGGPANPPFNNGLTMVHEAGHWLGLFHTFEGGCVGNGDYVSDTPPEAYPSNGFCGYRDTCTNDNLPDPTNNYMDYSYATGVGCGTNFTPGQIIRLRGQIATYRGIPQ